MTARATRSARLAGLAARISYAALGARPPGGAPVWTRTNHRGEPITLLEGPAVAIGGVAGALAGTGGPRQRLAVALAGAGAGAFGCYDDLAGDGGSRGFRGHLGALRKGELTTGAVKIAGIGTTGLAVALLAGSDAEGGAASSVTDALINAGLVAGGANLLNLFDLRPGRAVKVAAVAGGLLAGSAEARQASAAPLAAAVALLPEDLGERSMLGDAGANALGAMLGAAAATTLPRPARAGALAVIVGLTAASEVVSFSRVIERTGPLRWLDLLGRRPVAAGQDEDDTTRRAAESGAPRSGPTGRPDQADAAERPGRPSAKVR